MCIRDRVGEKHRDRERANAGIVEVWRVEVPMFPGPSQHFVFRPGLGNFGLACLEIQTHLNSICLWHLGVLVLHRLSGVLVANEQDRTMLLTEAKEAFLGMLFLEQIASENQVSLPVVYVQAEAGKKVFTRSCCVWQPAFFHLS